MNLFAMPYRGATSAAEEENEQDWFRNFYSGMTDASLDNVIRTAQHGEFDSEQLRYALAEKKERSHATINAQCALS